MRKNLFILLVTIMLGTTGIFAQNNTSRKARKPIANGQMIKHHKLTPERMLEFRISHLSRELMLKDSDKKQFATIYTNYYKELQELIQKNFPKKEVNSDKKIAPKEFSEEDIDKMFSTRINSQIKRLQLQEKYYNQFRKFLSARQVTRIFKEPSRFVHKKQSVNHPQLKKHPMNQHQMLSRRHPQADKAVENVNKN